MRGVSQNILKNVYDDLWHPVFSFIRLFIQKKYQNSTHITFILGTLLTQPWLKMKRVFFFPLTFTFYFSVFQVHSSQISFLLFVYFTQWFPHILQLSINLTNFYVPQKERKWRDTDENISKIFRHHLISLHVSSAFEHFLFFVGPLFWPFCEFSFVVVISCFFFLFWCHFLLFICCVFSMCSLFARWRVRELTLLFSHLQRQRNTKKVLHNSYHTLLSGLWPYSSPYVSGDRYAPLPPPCSLTAHPRQTNKKKNTKRQPSRSHTQTPHEQAEQKYYWAGVGTKSRFFLHGLCLESYNLPLTALRDHCVAGPPLLPLHLCLLCVFSCHLHRLILPTHRFPLLPVSLSLRFPSSSPSFPSHTHRPPSFIRSQEGRSSMQVCSRQPCSPIRRYLVLERICRISFHNFL